jgi:hypothetical protein
MNKVAMTTLALVFAGSSALAQHSPKNKIDKTDFDTYAYAGLSSRTSESPYLYTRPVTLDFGIHAQNMTNTNTLVTWTGGFKTEISTMGGLTNKQHLQKPLNPDYDIELRTARINFYTGPGAAFRIGQGVLQTGVQGTLNLDFIRSFNAQTGQTDAPGMGFHPGAQISGVYVTKRVTVGGNIGFYNTWEGAHYTNNVYPSAQGTVAYRLGL